MNSTLQQFPLPPFSPLNINTHSNTYNSSSSRRPSSQTSSTPSSRTTSPPASPTSTLRRRHQLTSQASPHHLFNLSFHPTASSIATNPGNGYRPLHTVENHHDDFHGNAQYSINSSRGDVSRPPTSVLRGRSSLMVLRRRPSAVDRALSEERYRCDEDAIERQGLNLMEPRPVDMQLPISMLTGETSLFHCRSPSASSAQSELDGLSAPAQHPRFVMGGIFEVMEGRA
ncbi:hypothetical protein PDE_00633 [Penicillium oxalicum 114-2]|uniref:Uncharacterized protein n=1 Tax=Penicillium oxalicum (strain 114-2 / CGMCC 5302) TaxID=933388 RepID=S7Z6E1_PENO1|nr:hypothetical protein PDE_00633 [Penicillium oxalicum 114-2]